MTRDRDPASHAQRRDLLTIFCGYRPVCRGGGNQRVQELQRAGLLAPEATWLNLSPQHLTLRGRALAVRVLFEAPQDTWPAALRHEAHMEMRRLEELVTEQETAAAALDRDLLPPAAPEER